MMLGVALIDTDEFNIPENQFKDPIKTKLKLCPTAQQYD